MKIVAWIIGVPVALFVLLLALGGAISVSESGKPPAARTEKQKYEHAALECWKEYERKSLTPMEKVQIAGFCEGLEKTAKAAR